MSAEELKEWFEVFKTSRQRKHDLALDPNYSYFVFGGISFDTQAQFDYTRGESEMTLAMRWNEQRRNAFVNTFEQCSIENVVGLLNEQFNFFIRKYPDKATHWLDTIEEIVYTYCKQFNMWVERKRVNDWKGKMLISTYNTRESINRPYIFKPERKEFELEVEKGICKTLALTITKINGDQELKFEIFNEWLHKKRQSNNEILVEPVESKEPCYIPLVSAWKAIDGDYSLMNKVYDEYYGKLKSKTEVADLARRLHIAGYLHEVGLRKGRTFATYFIKTFLPDEAIVKNDGSAYQLCNTTTKDPNLDHLFHKLDGLLSK